LDDHGGVERVALLVEPLDVLHVGRADELAVGAVGPGVVRALERLAEATRLLAADPRAAMTADVEERAQHALAIAQHDDRFAADRAQKVLPGLGHPHGTADAVPGLGEDLHALLGEDRLRGVVLAGQCSRARSKGRGGGLKIAHDVLDPAAFRSRIRRCAASCPAPPRIPGPGWVPAPPRYRPAIGVAWRP